MSFISGNKINETGIGAGIGAGIGTGIGTGTGTKTNDEYDKLCLICMDVEGEIILCSKCKYVYCAICAKKINRLCSICFRNRNGNGNGYEYEYGYGYGYEYENRNGYVNRNLNLTSRIINYYDNSNYYYDYYDNLYYLVHNTYDTHYDAYYDTHHIESVYEPSSPYYYVIISIVCFGRIILYVVFGCVGILFLLKIFYSLLNFTTLLIN